jgi:hypothetical protein
MYKSPLFALAVAATLISPVLTSSVMAKEDTGTTVEVWGRSWLVTPVEDQADTYWAVRDNNNNNPFGRPARLRTHQAIRAITSATGCGVIQKSMIQTISGRFQARVSCRK